MANFMHIEDLVGARELIVALNQKVAELKAANDKWQLSFDVRIEAAAGAGSHELELVIIAKVGERGIQRRLPRAEVIRFSGDYQTLSNHIADQLLDSLLRQQVRDELSMQFAQAAISLEKLMTK